MYDAAETTRFVIYPSPNAGKSPNTCMGFATDDIDAEVRDLKARGVVFEEYDYPTLKTVDSYRDHRSSARRLVPRFGGEHHRAGAAAACLAADVGPHGVVAAVDVDHLAGRHRRPI